MQKLGKVRVKAIPSTEPAARDEGPRLIPLRTDAVEELPMSHYLQLADKALGTGTAARQAKIKKQDGAEEKSKEPNRG